MVVRAAIRRLRSGVAKRLFPLSADQSHIGRLAKLLGSRCSTHKKISACLALGLVRRINHFEGSCGLTGLSLSEQIRYRMLCGEANQALSFFHDAEVFLQSGGQIDDAELVALATLAVKADPNLAWRFISCCRRSPPAAAAIAISVGLEIPAVSRLLDECEPYSADALLLRANLACSLEYKLEYLNRFFARHRLTAIKMEQTQGPLSIRSFRRATASLTPVRSGPLISVLMAGHNVEDYVEAAIRSILWQSYENLELIYVDDASTDQSVERVEILARTDARIKVVRLPENVGTYAAKNVALDMALGEYVAFHDADDWSHPEKYRISLQALTEDRRRVAVTSCYVRVTEEGRFVSHTTWPLTRWTPNSIVFRRDVVLSRIGYLDNVRFGADSEFVARIRCAFGERGHLKLRLPMTLALHRTQSLMNASDTGLDATGYSRKRTQYQETWMEWHLWSIAEGKSLFLKKFEKITEMPSPFNREDRHPVGAVLSVSSGIRKIPFVNCLLSCQVHSVGYLRLKPDVCAVVGWGAKPSGRKAAQVAQGLGVPPQYLEDGFLRSHGTGELFPPLSLVVDDQGIYYDSTRPSSLETFLNSSADVLAGIAADVERAKALLLQHRLSKYNHAPDWTQESHLLSSRLPRTGEGVIRRVLVIDQTAGDMSVSLAGAGADTFTAMLAAAHAENPQATIYVKTHPEVSSGRKGGYLTHVQDDERTVVLRQAINPLSLIEQMDQVYVVTSTMGFEALLAGKSVTVFGMPWYAGWGGTDDRQACARRIRKRSVDELFAAAYFHYARYLNPVTHSRGTIFDVIDWLVRQREMAARFPGRMICVGFRRWKAVNIKPLLSLDQKQVVFVPCVEAAEAMGVRPGDCLIYWGREAPAGLLELAERNLARALRMEDGFVRSVGLGSDLIRPLSLVLDECGIYFDPTQPSDLEHILNTGQFPEGELARARRVREFIVEHGITKYNLEPRQTVGWQPGGKEVVLVPGQVEDDASISYGCTVVKTNLGLLQAARRAHPNAFVVYKPHPDVTSSNRAGRLALHQALGLADHVETRLSVVSCIEACDVVHTMTSLTGFDALLRGKRVVVYGQPFYAGWGLTEDVAEGVAFARRQRRLTLDELVAGTLLRYPIYWDWDLKGYTNCEAVLHRIVEARNALEANGGLERLRVGFVRRQLRKLGILVKSSMINA